MSHCLSCWDDPSLGPALVFSQLQVLLSHLWELKKKEKEEIKRGRKEEGIKQERKRGLKIKKIIKNNYFKEKKKSPADFQLAKPILLVFLAVAG